MFKIKFLYFVAVLTLFKVQSFGQSTTRFEQIAFDYFVEVIAKNDSSIIELQMITNGKVKNIRAQYHEICEDVGSLLDSDSLYLEKWLEEQNQDYWRNYDSLPIAHLKVSSVNTMPKKITRNKNKLEKLLEIVSVSHKLEFRNSFYVTINTRYFYDDRGITVNIKMNRERKVIGYCLGHWIG